MWRECEEFIEREESWDNSEGEGEGEGEGGEKRGREGEGDGGREGWGLLLDWVGGLCVFLLCVVLIMLFELVCLGERGRGRGRGR